MVQLCSVQERLHPRQHDGTWCFHFEDASRCHCMRRESTRVMRFHLKSYQDKNTSMIVAHGTPCTCSCFQRCLLLLPVINSWQNIGPLSCCCHSAQFDITLLLSAGRAATTDIGNAPRMQSMASSPIKVSCVCLVCTDCGAHAPSPSASTERGSFSWLINFLPNQDPPENGPP